MPRFAIQLTSEFMSSVGGIVGTTEQPDFFDDKVFLVLEAIGPAEFNLKFLTEEEIFDEAQQNDDLQYLSL
jgi:hypothetical protein